jgi:hypothetical protein
MDGPCERAHVITHEIKPIERVNLQLALDRWQHNEKGRTQVLGGYYALLAQLPRDRFSVLGPVERVQLPRAPGEVIDCVTRGLFLLHFEDKPIVLHLSPGQAEWMPPHLALLAHEHEVAQAALSRLLKEVNHDIVYKGKTIYLEKPEGIPGFSHQVYVRFHELPPVCREEIILPEAVMTAVERNALGILKHRELLHRSGRSTRHGLLFHGAPGTGKTLMLRYLAHACPDHTIVLLTGRQMGLIRESCEVARLLAPSLIVMEDVDLVAEDRERNRSSTLLHELMDEMDGLGPKAECIFLLTTNRPEILEPALTARPGRIDQAIEFPLPDENCRRRLFALYSQGLDLATVEIDRWIEKTSNVSPAFIQELLRKAALMAAERGETSVPLRLQESDLEEALSELVCLGGELTQKLLGYRAFGFKTREQRV